MPVETPAGRTRVVVVGDVMTDVVVRLGGPIATNSDTRSVISLSPGGSATNQAVWLARQGADVHLVGVVGDDEVGRASLRALRDEGVAVEVTELPGVTSGIVVDVVETDGRRSMLTDRGANFSLAQARLSDSLFSALGHLHLSGYELLDEETHGPALSIAARAKDAQMTRSVDPCSAGPLAAVGADAFLSWTEGFDLCCSNLDEGRVLTGRDDPLDVAIALAARYPTVVVTLGEEGAIGIEDGAGPVVLAARPAAVVDTTGAGDAFTGSFLAAWLSGIGLAGAVEAGLEAAAVAIGTVGVRPPR